MASYQDVRHLISLLYIFPTFILYFIILYTIFLSSLKKKFSASFYRLFGFSAINYIVHTVTYYIVYRMNSTPILVEWLGQASWPAQSFLYPLIYTLTYFTAFGIHIYSLALSFNRFTVFILGVKYTDFWEKALKFVLAACVIIPLILIWNFPFIGIKHGLKVGDVLWISPSITDFAPWWNRTKILFYEISITAILSLLMNIYVMFSIFKLRYYGKNSAKHISRQDKVMIIYSMLVFLTEMYSCILQYLLELNNAAFLPYVLATQFIAADCSTLAPAWFVFIINKELRKAIIQLFVRPKYRIPVVTISGTVAPRSTSHQTQKIVT